MTAPGQTNTDQDEEHDAKPQRGFDAEEIPALVVACAVGLLPILMAIVAYSVAANAVWPMGIGAGLIVLGLWGGIRGAIGCGVLLLAIGGMMMSSDSTLGAALLTNAVIIVLCLVVLIGTDLSFTMRRGSELASDTVQGYARVHAVALGVGVIASAVVVAGVETVDWPSWLIVVPIAGLTVAALSLVRWVRTYRSTVREADAPVVGRGPAPTNPNTRWRDFKWQENQE